MFIKKILPWTNICNLENKIFSHIVYKILLYILCIILKHITNCITSNFCDPIILSHILVWSNKFVIGPNIEGNVYQNEYYQDIYNPKNNTNLDDLQNWMV
jgi:hypothetical protein